MVAIFGVQEKKGEKFFYLFFQPFNLITSKARRFTHNFEVIRLKGFADFLAVKLGKMRFYLTYLTKKKFFLSQLGKFFFVRKKT